MTSEVKSILKSTSTPLPSSTPLPVNSRIGKGTLPSFRVDLKYRNALPSVPFDPKFLHAPQEDDYLWGFKQSTLEKNYKYKIHMNPPQLSDVDLIDPLGVEEWAKAVFLDDKDAALQRKEGADTALVSKHALKHREEKSWMLKTQYTDTGFAVNVQASRSTVIVEEENIADQASSVLDYVEKQFEYANSEKLPVAVTSAGKAIKRVIPFLPMQNLEKLKLHYVKFKPGERLESEKYLASAPIANVVHGDDLWAVSNAILVHRALTRKRQNPYTPLSLFLPKRVAEGEEVAKENKVETAQKDTYHSNVVGFARDYFVSTTAADRLAIILDENEMRYVSLDNEGLRLNRASSRVQRLREDDEGNVVLVRRSVNVE